MGTNLSEPITTKQTERIDSARFKVGLSSMQGWRGTMEDAHSVHLSVPDDPESVYFGVFDGHGGKKISNHACDYLLSYITRQAEYIEGDIVTAIQKAFMEMDKALKSHSDFKYLLEGSTAVVVLIKDGYVYCGNAGDSRAIACVDNELCLLSLDHKPTVKTEERRIIAAGGWVTSKRVNGNLSLSRAFGDFVFKYNNKKTDEEQIITALPDVTVHRLTTEWEFIVLACDGIWDVMSSSEVRDFVKERLKRKVEPEIICEEMMDHCLAPELASTNLGFDNMTAILAVFDWSDVSSMTELSRPEVNAETILIEPTQLMANEDDVNSPSIEGS